MSSSSTPTQQPSKLHLSAQVEHYLIVSAMALVGAGVGQALARQVGGKSAALKLAILAAVSGGMAAAGVYAAERVTALKDLQPAPLAVAAGLGAALAAVAAKSLLPAAQRLGGAEAKMALVAVVSAGGASLGLLAEPQISQLLPKKK